MMMMMSASALQSTICNTSQLNRSRLAQDCDTRFALWTERDGSANHKIASLPSCHFGRLTVNAATKTENEFLLKSKLGLKRRPEKVIKLPKFHDMIELESLAADADVLTRERQTTSIEKLAAQKGPDFGVQVLKSLLDGVGLTTSTPVFLVEFTPYLGDNAMAVRQIQHEHPNWNLSYMSFETDKKQFECANARVSQLLAKEWLEKKWEHPTLAPMRECPALPQAPTLVANAPA